MDHPIEFDQIPDARPMFSGYDSPAPESIEEAGQAQGDVYQQIAARRAQLECAETLRRVRAL